MSVKKLKVIVYVLKIFTSLLVNRSLCYSILQAFAGNDGEIKGAGLSGKML